MCLVAGVDIGPDDEPVIVGRLHRHDSIPGDTIAGRTGELSCT